MDCKDINVLIVPSYVSTVKEAKSIFEATEADRLRWKEIVTATLAEVDHALREYHHALRQLALADQQAGKARFVMKKSGYSSIARPQATHQTDNLAIFCNNDDHVIELSEGSIGVVLD